MMRPAGRRWPSREVVYQVAREEADKAGLSPAAVLGVNGRRVNTVPRKRAWLRLIDMGYSMNGISEVWGCDRKSLWRAFHEAARAA